jgi:membrane associated rhomboid family serine protease/lipoprotein NlpI
MAFRIVASDVDRAGIWRRGFALLVDLIVVEVVLQLIAAVLLPLSNGHVIDTNSVFTSCESATVQPAGVTIPAAFESGTRSICTQSILGLPTSRQYVVQNQSRGSLTTTTALNFTIDPAGRFTTAIDIALFQGVVLVLMRWALDRYTGASLGRRLARIRLVRFAGSDDPEVVHAALMRRYVLFALPLIPALIANVVLGFCELLGSEPHPVVSAVVGVAQHVPLWIGLACVLPAILRHREAFYDEPCGTAVTPLVAGDVQVFDGPAPARPRDVPLQAMLDDVLHGAARAWPRLTVGLIVVLAAVFLAETLHPVSPATPDGTVSLRTMVVFGGANKELVVQIGQWYRLLTEFFLHASAAHLVVNALILLAAGWVLEGVMGRAWFLAVFLLGGIAGAVASTFWNPPSVLTIGASGSLMALLAAGVAVSFALPEGPRRRWTRAFCVGVSLPTLLIGGQTGLGTIDTAAHVGGAFGGTVLGNLMLYSGRLTRPGPRYGTAALGAALALCAGLLVSVPIVGFGDPPMSALMISAAEMPKNDEDWVSRAVDLAHRYPRDPRPHLALAMLHEREGDASGRESELDLASKSERLLDPADARPFEENALSLVGDEAAKRHDRIGAEDLLTRAIALAPTKADLYRRRCHLEMLDQHFDDALRDARMSASLLPGDARAQTFVGDVQFAKGDLPAALDAYDKGAAIAPREPLNLRSRGWARFFDGQGPAAMSDLEAATKGDPKDAYASLWLDIVAVRSGFPNGLASPQTSLERQAWPEPVIRFYRGELDEKALMASASDPDRDKADGRRCEAEFYIGEWNIMQHRQVEALPHLKNALVICPTTFDEWFAVRAELKGGAGYRADEVGSNAR